MRHNVKSSWIVYFWYIRLSVHDFVCHRSERISFKLSVCSAIAVSFQKLTFKPSWTRGLLDRSSPHFCTMRRNHRRCLSVHRFCHIPVHLGMSGRRMKVSRPILAILTIKLVAMATFLDQLKREGRFNYLRSNT